MKNIVAGWQLFEKNIDQFDVRVDLNLMLQNNNKGDKEFTHIHFI